jgi:thiamine pyrophosphokinase
MDSPCSAYLEFYREQGVPLKEYSSDKDKTDTQLCIEYALTFSNEIVLLGATGSRIDHTLANVSLLKLGLDKNIPISMIDNKNNILMIKDCAKSLGKKGDLFSLIPFSEKVEGLCTKGAHYELSDAKMEIGSSFGISNYFEETELTVNIKSGYLLLIKSND